MNKAVVTSSMSWEQVIGLLDPEQPIPVQFKSKGTVEYWREWDAQRGRAVWGKRYIANEHYDLRAFNNAEINLLLSLSSAKVGNTYRRASFEQVGTRLAEPSVTTIKTFDCGPTLDDWMRTPVSLGGRLQSHCFVQPEAFLRMAQSVLFVLEGVHACHFVHCDLHQGNITLPMRLINRTAEGARLIPCWDDITLIDFGYSINTKSPPATTLPLDHHNPGMRVSPLLKRILDEVEASAKVHLKPGQQWGDVRLDPAWWFRLPQSPLAAFSELDWREDLYQFGCTLVDIRDGTGEYQDLFGGCTIAESNFSSDVDRMVNELPERLIELGRSSQRPEKRPHLELVESIQRLLNQAKIAGVGCPNEYLLHKSSFDSNPQYLTKPIPTPAPAVETPLNPRINNPTPQDNPAWVEFVPNLPLPLMRPLRVAAPIGWQLTVASTPVTWRQWKAACQYNPDLYCPAVLSISDPSHEQWLDTAVTQVSHADCLAYISTINYLCNANPVEEMALFRLPNAAEWALLTADEFDDSAATAPHDIQNLPVNAWAPNSQGIAGLRYYLWQWQAASAPAAWAAVRGGCVAQIQACGKHDRDPVDQYPTTYRSPFITLRLVRHVPISIAA